MLVRKVKTNPSKVGIADPFHLFSYELVAWDAEAAAPHDENVGKLLLARLRVNPNVDPARLCVFKSLEAKI